MQTIKIKRSVRLTARVMIILALLPGLLGFRTVNTITFKPKGVRTIVIDAGHGGKDPGCNGLIHNEKDVTLSIALKLGKLIEENIKDVKVIYTRKTDVFVELEERAQIANRNEADLFISIHCNAASTFVTYTDKKGKKRKKEVHNPKPFGAETYVMGIKNEKGKLTVAKRENAAMLMEDNYEKTYNGFDPNSDEAYIIMSLWTGAFVEQSADFAAKIQEEYVKKAGRTDKGVQRQSIWVLWRTAMPSVLTEVGFLTNPEEEKFLGSEKGQTYLASSIFRAFRKYKDEKEGRTGITYNDELENMEPLKTEGIAHTDKKEDKTAQQEEEAPEQLAKTTGGSRMLADTLDEIKIAEDEIVDEKYNLLIAEANIKEREKKWKEAEVLYARASSMYPAEKFPRQRREEILRLMKADSDLKEELFTQKAEKERKAKYTNLIREAEQKVVEKKYQEAHKLYLKAAEIDPSDSLTRSKIKETEELLALENKRRAEKKQHEEIQEKEMNYTSYISKAEKLTQEHKFAEAKTNYLRASALHPEDSGLVNKIWLMDSLILKDKRLAEQHVGEEKHLKFIQYVEEGDRKMSEKKYVEAKALFKKAAALDAKDTTVAYKIVEADRLAKGIHHKEEKEVLIAEREKEEAEKHYQAFVKTGDKKMAEKKYSEAKSLYLEAMELKSNNPELANKIKLAEKALIEKERGHQETEQLAKIQKERDEKYRLLITQADKLYEEKNYKEATIFYAKAVLMKPQEKYAALRGEEISKLLKGEKLSNSAEKVNKTETSVQSTSNELLDAYKIKSEKEIIKETGSPAQVKAVETKAEKDSKELSSAKENSNTQSIVFRVQFTVVEAEVKHPEHQFKGLEELWHYYNGGLYKYTAGKFSTKEEAYKYQEKIKKQGYTGSFVVAFCNDKRIEVNQAVKLAKK